MKKSRSLKWVRGLYAIVLVFALLSLTGCWSSAEINDLAVVNVMGVDRNEDGQVEVTSVIVKPDNLFSNTASSNKGGEQPGGSLIETTTGKSIFEAMSKLSSAVPERIYLGHLNVIVFGEQAARQKMASFLDFFKRERDFRPNIDLLVTKGSARNLIQMKPQMNTTLGLDLHDLTRTKRFGTAKMVNDISQFMEAMPNNTQDPYTGVIQPARTQGIDTTKEGKSTKRQQNSGRDGIKSVKNASTKSKRDVPKTLSLQDTAVFKGSQLKGFLDQRETRGLLSIKGKLENDVVVLDCGGNDKGTVSLSVKDSKSQFSPHLSGGTPAMDVKIHADASIEDITCSGFDVNSVSIDHLNKELANQITQDARGALEKAKNQWQTDIFGFGKAINRKNPKQWDRMASRWRNGELKKMNVHLTVSTDIKRHGLYKNPSQANESR